MRTEYTPHQIAVEQSRIYARELNKTLHELQMANSNLQEAYLDTIHRLAIAAEYRDGDTGHHIRRMGSYSALMARGAGLSFEEVQMMEFAAPMHDVGKIGIPDRILQKPGPLTVDEWEIIKTHCAIGAKILSGSKSTILKYAEEIALTHHERWDGSGYPRGLSGNSIPLSGRIVAIIDVYDALTTKRPYKQISTPEEACQQLKMERGTHFDPDLIDLFFTISDEVCKMNGDATQNISGA